MLGILINLGLKIIYIAGIKLSLLAT